MIKLGGTARSLRESLGLSQRVTADLLGVSAVHLCNVESNKSAPSQALIDRYRELWGIDLYVLAWCQNGDVNKLPEALRGPAIKLAAAWKKQIDKLINGVKDDSACSM
jgi:transcriptional regulator with XRE-family HTH domain